MRFKPHKTGTACLFRCLLYPSRPPPPLLLTTSTMADQYLGFDLSTQQLKGKMPRSSYPAIAALAADTIVKRNYCQVGSQTPPRSQSRLRCGSLQIWHREGCTHEPCRGRSVRAGGYVARGHRPRPPAIERAGSGLFEDPRHIWGWDAAWNSVLEPGCGDPAWWPR